MNKTDLKETARNLALKLFQEKQENDGVERILRINCLREKFGIEDVNAILSTKNPPPALMIPKVKTSEEVKTFMIKNSTEAIEKMVTAAEILNKEVFDYIDNRENCIFERSPLQNLSRDGQLMAFKHEGFWHPMDTLRDKNYLNKICRNRKFIWKK